MKLRLRFQNSSPLGGFVFRRCVLTALRSYGWLSVALVLAVAMPNTSCSGNGVGLDEHGNISRQILVARTDSVKADSIFKLIKMEILIPICARCHFYPNAPYGLALDTVGPEGLRGRPSYGVPGMQLVKPGDPANSYLLWKLQGKPGMSGFRMPFEGPFLPDSLMNRIASWINCL